jgi:hypothetical protein
LGDQHPMDAYGCILIMPQYFSTWCNRKVQAIRPSKLQTMDVPRSERCPGVRSLGDQRMTSLWCRRVMSLSSHRVISLRDQARSRPYRGSFVIGKLVTRLTRSGHSAPIGRLARRMACRCPHCRCGQRRLSVVCWPMSGHPPTRRAQPAGQGWPTQQTALHGRTSLPTRVPSRRSLRGRQLVKRRLQDRRNQHHRLPALRSCLPPAGPAGLHDGSGGHRARKIHASNSWQIILGK